MRHRARSRKLGRSPSHRTALYRNMVTSLLEHERIETTDAKAKEVRRMYFPFDLLSYFVSHRIQLIFIRILPFDSRVHKLC